MGGLEKYSVVHVEDSGGAAHQQQQSPAIQVVADLFVDPFHESHPGVFYQLSKKVSYIIIITTSQHFLF